MMTMWDDADRSARLGRNEAPLAARRRAGAMLFAKLGVRRAFWRTSALPALGSLRSQAIEPCSRKLSRAFGRPGVFSERPSASDRGLGLM
jgi:hypothetical protein